MKNIPVKSIAITPAEASLIALIRKIGFGEILDPLLADGAKDRDEELTEKETELVEVLRKHPNPEIIMIHDRAATYVVVRGEEGGFKYRQKIKL